MRSSNRSAQSRDVRGRRQTSTDFRRYWRTPGASSLHEVSLGIGGGLQAVAALVLAAAMILVDFLPFAAIVASAAAITVALHPARRRFVARVKFRPFLALLSLAVAVPAVLYGLEAATSQRDGVPPLALDSHGPLNSWAALAAAAFAVALVALLTSLGTGGFPIPGWSAGAAAAVWGLTALAHPDDPASEGRGWASFAVVWAVVFVAAVERERRRSRTKATAGTG